MSLNRFEQSVFDYLQAHPDELRHWENKVVGRAARGVLTAPALADELSDYVRERGGHVQPFRDWMDRGGVPRSALLNLAEHLLRRWGPVVTKKRTPDLR